MADFTSNITTIASLKDAFEHVPTQEEAGTDSVVNYGYTLQNDLDFNNEHYWFKESDFFYCNHISTFEDTTIFTENKTFQLNNKTISNIYLYEGIRLFTLDPYDRTVGSTYNLTFYDGTFEVISNNGTIFDLCVSSLPSGSGNANKLTTNVMFKNCVFNVKVLHNAADSNTSTPHTLFQNSKNTSTGDIRLQFVNCVFNIEFTPACTSTGSIVWTKTIYSASFQSCEFRIKDRSTSRASYNNPIIVYGGISRVIASNNIIFYDTDTEWSSTITIFYAGNTATTTNNFLASFYTYTNPIVVDFTYNNSIFYDSDKFSRYNTTGTVVTGLPTTDCKNVAALEAAGYVFANES